MHKNKPCAAEDRNDNRLGIELNFNPNQPTTDDDGTGETTTNEPYDGYGPYDDQRLTDGM